MKQDLNGAVPNLAKVGVEGSNPFARSSFNLDKARHTEGLAAPGVNRFARGSTLSGDRAIESPPLSGLADAHEADALPLPELQWALAGEVLEVVVG